MKYLQFFVFVFIALFNLNGQAVYGQTEAEVRQILTQRLGDANSKIGISVSLIDEKGTRFIGQPEAAATASGVYEIGSVTKVFTAVLLADMVKRGEVRLEDEAAKFLPATVKMPSKSGKQITLQHLATHTSGLPRLPDNLKPANPLNPYADYTVEQLYDFLSKHELRREIGEKYEYSNLGAGLLGHILSLRAKMSYEDLVKKRILEPLGMKNTAMTLTPAMQAKLAPGHNPFGKPTPNWDLTVLAGAGAFRSTPEDMAVFAAANLGLKKSKLDEVLTASHEPKTQAGSPDTKVALGWHVTNRNGNEIVWHNGGTGGYRSWVGFDKKRKKGVFVIANMQTDIDDIGFYLLGAGELQKTVEVAPEILDKYVGEYQVAPTFILTVTREGKNLFIQATNQQKLPVAAESETEFVQRQARARFRFNKNDKGEVIGLTLLQGGRETPAQKIK